MGCDAYAYAMVALGTMDLVLETGLKAWDIDAAIPVIEGAGGLVTDWLGQTIGPRPQDSAGQMLISATKACQDSALALLAKGAKGGAKG
jgi:fructose-1,6-bisphosphatase/inositol monophosphatase family enzyme